MTEAPFDQADIDGLAEALDALELPPRQRALLSAIVAVAAKVISTEVVDPVPSFREQFATAFTPGRATQLVYPLNITKHTP